MIQDIPPIQTVPEFLLDQAKHWRKQAEISEQMIRLAELMAEPQKTDGTLIRRYGKTAAQIIEDQRAQNRNACVAAEMVEMLVAEMGQASTKVP